MKKENIATCAHACDTRTPASPSFNELISAFKSKGGKYNNYEAGEAVDAWQKSTAAKKAKLLAAVRSGAHYKPRLDWLVTDFPEPQPVNYNGTAEGQALLASGQARIAKYNGRFGLYLLDDIRLFEMTLPEK